jgi:hypothetical protein
MTLPKLFFSQGEAQMETGTFRLKGSSLLSRAEKNNVENRHQLSLRSGISTQTIYSLFSGEPMKQLVLRVLAKILYDGIGFTYEELENVKFGDIFEYVEKD